MRVRNYQRNIKMNERLRRNMKPKYTTVSTLSTEWLTLMGNSMGFDSNIRNMTVQKIGNFGMVG